MEKNVINRKMYKDIKKYDRQEMERFLSTLYKEGFQNGAKSGDNADFKIKLVQVLQNTKGVGEKTIEKVLKTFKEMK